MNPGIDLLIAADWEGMLEGRVVKDPELPPLIGMGQFAAAANNRDTNAITTHEATATGSGLDGRLGRNLGLIVIFGLAAVIIGTILMKPRRPRS